MDEDEAFRFEEEEDASITIEEEEEGEEEEEDTEATFLPEGALRMEDNFFLCVFLDDFMLLSVAA